MKKEKWERGEEGWLSGHKLNINDKITNKIIFSVTLLVVNEKISSVFTDKYKN
jgi:hypothetical protein